MKTEGSVILEAGGVSKKYCRSLKRSIWYGAQDITGGLLGRRAARERLRPGEFWALRDVSLRLHRGECVGLIGANGAGKSTLLKLLSGIVPPDTGRITVHGRVSAMIELGAGFHPALSGRENIYVNASILGLSKREIDRRLDQIIEFSGLGSVLDTPVKFYSSGMYARLGFAVAAQLDPDILLVDEVLAVGDVAFQERCMQHMNAIRASDRTVVLVTHSLYRVESLCDSAVWLESGRVRSAGPARQVVREYLDWSLDQASTRPNADGPADHIPKETWCRRPACPFPAAREQAGRLHHASDGPLDIVRVETLDESGESTERFAPGCALTVRIHYSAKHPIARPLFNLRFLHQGQSLFECSMLIDGHGPDVIDGRGAVECLIPALPLTPNVYEIMLFVRSQEGIVDLTPPRTCAQFRVTDPGTDQFWVGTNGSRRLVRLHGPMAINHFRRGAPFFIEHEWRECVGQASSLNCAPP